MTQSKLQDTILRDLQRDLVAKTHKAVDHYIEMGQAAELDGPEACLAALNIFLQLSASIAISQTMSQEVFAQSAFNCYSCAMAEIRNSKS